MKIKFLLKNEKRICTKCVVVMFLFMLEWWDTLFILFYRLLSTNLQNNMNHRTWDFCFCAQTYGPVLQRTNAPLSSSYP